MSVLKQLELYNEIVKLPQFAEITSLSENSPWHREATVLRHTEMTIEWYDQNLAHYRTPRQRELTRLALAFHDLGKPAAKQEKFKPERGKYYAYHGHELVSARILEDFLVANLNKISPFLVSRTDIAGLVFTVENHLPYDRSKEKLDDLRQAVHAYLGDDSIIFTDVLLSDTFGRISDDQETKRKSVDDWVEKFNRLPVKAREYDGKFYDENVNTLYVLIGASGSGKSTWTNQFLQHVEAREKLDTAAVVSLDAYRIAFLLKEKGISEDQRKEIGEIALYGAAFDHAVKNDSAFKKFYNTDFTALLKKKQYLILDNVNASRKARGSWIATAKQHKFKVVGVYIPMSLSTLYTRAVERPDKRVPIAAVERQYQSISMPFIGREIDQLIIV